MRITKIIVLQKINEIALQVCAGSEYKTFSGWMQHADGFNPTNEQVAQQTGKKAQNVARDYKSLLNKNVLVKGPRERCLNSKFMKNTYELGPIFDSILNKTSETKEEGRLLPTSRYIPHEAIKNFQTIKERALYLVKLVEDYKLKINKYDGKKFSKMKNKLNEIEAMISAGIFKNIDYKIKDLVDFSVKNAYWIKIRLDNRYHEGSLEKKIEVPVFDDLVLPKLKETQ